MIFINRHGKEAARLLRNERKSILAGADELSLRGCS
jgi:hypothetical protein